MSIFVTKRDPPEKRRSRCASEHEHDLTEAAVMIAFAMHLLDEGAEAVELHPDGEHGKRYDIRGCLESLGFTLIESRGQTTYGGRYRRGNQHVSVSLTPGQGDVVARIKGKGVVAECKGGIINTRHSGQVSRLRRGLCEAVGLLMARPRTRERHIAVVPKTVETKKVAERMWSRALAAGIEIALVDENGRAQFIAVRSPRHHS